jgi:hypothetical protein
MHTTEINRPFKGHKAVFHHNGDYSGVVEIQLVDEKLEKPHSNFHIEFVVLKEFVGLALRDQVIDDVEQMSGDEFLNALVSF